MALVAYEGGVYLSASTRGDDHRIRLTTLRLNGKGELTWERHYDDPYTSDGDVIARLNDMAVDAAGNVVVGGWTDQADREEYADLLLIKYASDGAVLWITAYNGPDDFRGDEGAWDIDLDGEGNIYVAGFGDRETFLLYKFDAGGIYAWHRFHPRINTPGIRLFPRAVSVAPDASIFVSGNVCFGFCGSYTTTTLHYSPEGALLWEDTQPGEFADLAIDAAGHGVVLTRRFTVARYEPQGELEWATSYRGLDLESISAEGYDLAFGDDGQIYAGGSILRDTQLPLEVLTVQLNEVGEVQWDRAYIGTQDQSGTAFALAATADGVRTAGSTYEAWYQTAIIAYDTQGDQLWVDRREGEPSSLDGAHDMVMGEDGALYITGQSYSSPERLADAFTLKVGTNGSVIWTQRYDADASPDWGTLATPTPGGGVIITGYTLNQDATYDVITLRYDTDGMLLWENRYDVGSIDVPVGIVPDGEGGAYVTGWTDSASDIDPYDVFVFRVGSDGVRQWDLVDPGATNNWNLPVGIVQVPEGIAVGGYDSQATGRDYVTTWLNPDGQVIDRAYYRGYDPQGDNNERAYAITADSDGSVYISGSTESEDVSTASLTTVKYGPDREQEWVTHHIIDGRDSAPGAITLNREGGLAIAGRRRGSGASNIPTSLELGPEGELEWASSYDGPGRTGMATGVVVATDGAITTSGLSGFEERYDLILQNFSPEGELTWDYRVPAREADYAFIDFFYPALLAVDAEGDVYAVKTDQGEAQIGPLPYESSYRTFTVYKLDHLGPTGSETDSSGLPGLRLRPPYPNPSSGRETVTLSFQHPEPGPVHLVIYDLLGREVAVLLDEYRSAGDHTLGLDVGKLASGMYVCRLGTPNGFSVQKVLVAH